jgi:hypothetical protein
LGRVGLRVSINDQYSALMKSAEIACQIAEQGRFPDTAFVRKKCH